MCFYNVEHITHVLRDPPRITVDLDGTYLMIAESHTTKIIIADLALFELTQESFAEQIHLPNQTPDSPLNTPKQPHRNRHREPKRQDRKSVRWYD